MKKLATFALSALFASASFAGVGAWGGNQLSVITDANTPVEVTNTAGKVLASGTTNEYGRVKFDIANTQVVNIKAGDETKTFLYKTLHDAATR
ncbi:hypothetical protein [Endozoicomonas arenosclerae]|uniref:hypothetical protein n=1 Tax=Endozoicomonas arenosclerae TaxID=1633495 RepID=UPI000785B186|nr:hypothetical protein [Endozoicomonas arenosclerae]